ncbi:beta family protein [Streptomyces camelliae]|uniref:Beta protein n=1 Tax=Streptomyces camelliae TaxID=3004093 RepID=A0ABY7P8V3_9ACTN|nr:hypothetical protein [Streptomyces sp. HUAS 2-6]WBO66998.1 hypothetical protein O1G22_31405 [Streptomyces sp. HUAS 2-6]
MVEPLYVPVLPARRNAWEAYERLDFSVRGRIAPLWTLVPRIGPERTRGVPSTPKPDPDNDRATLDSWLTPRTDRLIEAMDGLPGWLDAVHVEGSIHGAASGLWRLATRSRLRLVTGPERDPAIQRYTADLAALSERGMGIRVLVDAPPDEPRSNELLALLNRLRLPPSLTDLILDLGAVTDAGEAGKTAVAALDVLGTLLPWRTVVLTSGAFPRMYDSPGTELHIAERYDRQLHQTVRAARPAFPGTVVYGDYSAEHAFSANIPHVRESGPPWGLMRYTGPDTFLIGRVPTRGGGGDRIDRVRAMARRITESAVFRGADCSDGERWLIACAQGEGAKGSGSAETWIKVGHVQHMNFVMNQLLHEA